MSTAGTTDLPLEVFSGLVTEIAPSDLPAGASPNCQDVQFPLGAWKTRPGLGGGVFAALANNATVNYQKTFSDQQRNNRFLFFDSNGNVNQEFPQGTLTTGINTMPAFTSSRAKSATAYGKEYIAFSDGQFGLGNPAQWDGLYYDRVSQVGPGAAPTAVDSGAAGNIPAGVHKVSVFFITRSGYWTKPAPFGSWTAGGNKKVSLTNIPTGPPNVTQRVVIFTTAAGAVFFFTTNASSTLANGNMVIADNTTTTLTVDFSDTILAAGSNAQYLFNLLELEPSAGVVAYATRLFWWGGLNRVPNFINLPFDGGFGGTPTLMNAGPNSPTSGTSPLVIGGTQWTNPGNVLAADGALASVILSGSFPAGASDAIKATGYGFAIPGNATIQGIVVKALVKASAANVVSDYRVLLFKAGTLLIFSDHHNGNLWSNSLTYQTYGSSSDLWGTTWTPTDINNANFGVAFAAANGQGGTNTAYCDYISVQVFYTTPGGGTVPLGWTAGASAAGGGSAITGMFPVVWGDAYAITGDGATAVRGQITQSAYQDYLSNTILMVATAYGVRARVASAGGLTQGTLHINLQSTSGSFTTSGLSVQAGQTGAAYAIFTATILTSALTTIPTDILLQVYADGTPNNGGVFLVDDIEIYPLNQPNLTTTARASYAGQPESYDQLSGVLQPFFQDGGTIRNMFVLREKLYCLKDNSWYVTQDDGANEPSAWVWTVVSLAVGCSGINALDIGEDWGIAANRAGPYVFWGGEPIKIGQEIETDTSNSGKPTWDSINWAFGYRIWVLVDRVRKRALIGAPINGAISPNVIFYFDFVGADNYEQVADHWSVKYSQYSGKILAIGNAPKWAPWAIASNSAALIERNDGTAHSFIGNGSAAPYTGPGPSNTGKIYDLLDSNKSDDSAGIPWSYSTYLTPSHLEEQALQIKSHRKLYSYLAGYAKGSGAMAISAQPMGNTTPIGNLPLQLVDPTVSNAITGISRVSGVTTVTCAGGHGLTAGIDVQAVIQNAADPSFNGTVPIQQVLNPTQFTFAQYLLPDLILGAVGTVNRLSREFEFTTNILGERVSYTFSNSGNAAGSWCQMEKIIFSIIPDPWSPVRGGPY